MKILIFAFVILSSCGVLFSQNEETTKLDSSFYRIIKIDKGVFIGQILEQNARELLLLTKENRKIFIPQHLIKEIIKIEDSEFSLNDVYIGEDDFSTRYFLTTNGLPLKKGSNYVQWNLFGPDFQFSLGNNFGVGIMTTWIGVPLIGTVKKSWELGENTQLAVGGLIGTMTWVLPGYGGALPYGAISFGDRRRNISLSAGYGAVWYDNTLDGRGLTSVAGMIKVSKNLSIVFDSFILLPTRGDNLSLIGSSGYKAKRSTFGFIIPGVRWHKEEGKAFQFGFVAIVSENFNVPVPIPMIQWYRKL